MSEFQEVQSVLAAIRDWPESQRISLARMIMQTVESPAIQRTVTALAERRGKPVEMLIGLGASDGPPPSDELVDRWIDEHQMEKYSS